MRKMRISKSRLAAAVVLVAILVVGILFPTSGSSAKFTTQTSFRGSVSYLLDTSLATGLSVTNVGTYKLIPGTTVTPGATVSVTGRTALPAYLFVTIIGDYVPDLTADWTLLEGVAGPSNGKVYLYGGGELAIEQDVTAGVFKPFELGAEPATAGGDAFVSAYLVEKVEDETPAASFEARTGRTSTLLKNATEKFELATVEAVANGDYTVQNTGNIDAYIRAKVVLNRVDGAGNIEADGDPLLKEGVPELTPPAGWTQVGDYLYYNYRVASNGTTKAEYPAFSETNSTEVAEGVTVTLIAEAIQADGGAAEDAWKVTPTETADGVSWTATP